MPNRIKMVQSKKQLKKLGYKQFVRDIKKYIKSPHEFYGMRVPELKTLAKRLHKEHELKDYYKVFNNLWNSGYHEEMFLSIYALQLYKDDFNLKTWRFLKPKLKEMKSWDQVDSIGKNVLGIILLRNPSLKKEIKKLSKGKNIWLRRMAIIALIPMVRKNKIKFPLEICESCLYDSESEVQRSIGRVLKEIGKKNPEETKKFILKHSDMHYVAFETATEKLKELRKIKKIKKLKSNKKRGFFGFIKQL